jgi:putative endonuclease
MRTTDALGAYGESLAARLLTEEGMVLLDRNWRGESGEIDLVLRDGRVLVVCEVKTRSSLACGSPHEAVTDAKVARMRRLAEEWVRAHAVSPQEIRLDYVAVVRPRRGPSVVDHVQGIG